MICDQCETVKHCTKYGCIPERIGKPKPAAQRQQSWIGLTDGDVKEIREQCDSIVTLHAIKAIEAKLREKNT